VRLPPYDNGILTESTETRTVKSFCRICTAVCGIYVDVVGDQVVRVRGDQDHPFSHGYTCPKGRALPQVHHHPQRLERPLMKIGDRLEPTTWDACLDDLATRLRAIIDTDGPQAIGVFFGSGVGMDSAGYRTAEALYAALGKPPRFSPLTIDGTAKTLISDLVGGFRGLSPHIDYEGVKLVVYVGNNPVVSHGHTSAMPDPVTMLRALREHADIWVIDPRRTETARLATHHLAPRPGADYAVLAFLVRELLEDGANREVLAHRTVGSDELRAAVAPFTVEHAAQVAGVPETELTQLLDSMRRAGRFAVVAGTGVTMSASANVTMWLAWELMIITDSMNRPGGVWFHPGFAHQLEAFDLPLAPPEGSLFGPGPRTRPASQSFMGEWPCAVLADEIRAGNIRAVLNFGFHLLTSFPDANELAPALQSLDVVATIEIIANDTTALSTHVLPTKDQLERADVTLWDALMPRVAAQYTPAIVDPVGDRRSAWWVIAEIGRRLGYELPTGGEHGSDDEVIAKLAGRFRCTFEDLVAESWVERPYELPAPWVERHLDRLGGWRLAPAVVVEQLAILEPPAPLVLTPRRQVRHLNSQLDGLGEVVEVIVHPDDAAAAGVVDGQREIVRSSQGELVGVAKVDASVRAGAVSVPHGHQGANVNLLTCDDDIDLTTGMAHYSGFPVTLEPVPTGD